MLSLVRAQLAHTVGDADSAAALGEEGLQIADESGLRSWLSTGHAQLALVALHRADLNTAKAHVQSIGEGALLGHSPVVRGLCAWATVQVMEAHSAAADVTRLIEGLVDFGPMSRELLISQPAAAPWLVRLALTAGDRETALQAVQAAQRLGEMNPTFPTVVAEALHARGLFEGNLGDLRRAAATQTDIWAKASIMEDISGQLASRHSQRDDAIKALEDASDAYHAAGAVRDLSRIRRKLRESGAKHRDPRRAHRPRAETSDLTETEFAVAQLVAQGLTNSQVAKRLFLSHHTIAFHLRKIYPKLGVTSRIQLAGAWSQLHHKGRVPQSFRTATR